MKLQYGSESEIPDVNKCIDLGVVPGRVAPETLENRDMSENNMELIRLYGSKIPAIRRVWLTIAHYRNKDVVYPYTVKIPGVGQLVVGLDKFGCECWTVINS